MVAAGGRHAAHIACQTSLWDSLDSDFSVCKIGADPRRISHLRPNCGPCPRESFRHRLYPIQSLFTGTIAKVASLVAIVIGGYGFAHGEPGAKKALAGVAAGTGIAVLAVNVLSWLWGV
jgi:hypothetical protein